MDLTQLLAFTIQNSASDLHLSAGSPPIIRSSGLLKRVKADPLSSDDIRTMLYSVMTEQQRAEFEKEYELDFAISLGEKARFRVNAFTVRLGAAAVFRTIPTEVPSMGQLGLPPVLRRLAELETGIVLVTGATGSGKSTTLAAMLNHINETSSKHILTIEDPVEFFHKSKKSLVNHREIGSDTKGFQTALKSALREDPDVILVGEMRDYETISLALTAAETGHLVFGTLHASSASKTIDRIIDVFPSDDKEMIRAMLAGSIQGIIAQRLLRRADGGGRIGAFEILIGTNAVRNLIRENQIPQIFSMLQTGSRYGMITMPDAVADLLEAGLIDKDEARRAILAASDEEEEGGDGFASAALGGGKVDDGGGQAQPSSPPKPQSPSDADEGYSF
ncbi:MAG: type IV pilus twitching motility protein PilT [Bdellovibrionales bacterium]